MDDPREVEFMSTHTVWDGIHIIGWSVDMPMRERQAMLAEEDARDHARRLEILSDPGRSIAPKEETVNPQHQDEARER